MTDRPCFIYAITHIENGRRYIGSSVDVTYRWIKHRSELKNNRHHCKYLQNSWNKHGKETFSFSIIDQLPTNDRVQRALLELKHIAAAPCYNARIAATNLQNFENSPATKRRIAKGLAKAIKDDPEYAAFLKNRGAEIAAHMRSPEGRKKAAQHTKRRWKDPEQRKQLAAGLIRRWKRPDARKIQSDKLKAARGTPEARLKNSETAKARWADPNSKMHTRKQTRWANPKTRKIQGEKMRAYHAARRAAKSQ